jgi:predicted RND superfamily exporter protein/outer membrane lipoprotein-sorting protein
MRGFAVFLTKHCRTVALAIGFITVVLGIGATKLSVVIDPDEILPQNHRYIMATNEVDRLFGNKFAVVIGLTAKSGNALRPDVLKALSEITAKISVAPGVVRASVLSLGARKVKDIRGNNEGLTVRPMISGAVRSPEDIEYLKEAIGLNPVYKNFLLSRDGDTVSVIAEFRKDAGGFKAIVQRVDDIVSPYRTPELDIAIGGQPRFLALIEMYSDRMIFLLPVALILIGLVHWEAFRSIQGLVLPLATGLLAVVWSVGILGWSGRPLDAFNSTTPILILAVAAGHAVQILKRYYEEFWLARSRGEDRANANRTAVIESLVTTGPVMLTAGCIAATSFASLALFGIATIRTFGIFTAFGILSAVLIEMTLIPALRIMLPAPNTEEPRSQGSGGLWARLADRLADLTLHRSGTVLAVSGLLLSLTLVGASHVRIDNSMRAYFMSWVPARLDDARLNRTLPGVNVLFVLVRGRAADAIKRPDILSAMQETQLFLEREPQVGKTLSLANYVQRIDAVMNGDHSKGAIPDKQDLVSQFLFLYDISGEPTDFDSLVDSGYRNAVIFAYLNEDSSVYLSGLATKLRGFMNEHFPRDVETFIGGNAMSPVAQNEVLVPDKLLNMLQIAGVVFAISAICFRSVAVGLLVLVPLGLTVAAVFGLMGLTGIPLQVATVTVAAMGVGIGADYAIYLCYRLREEVRRCTSDAAAIRRTFETAGKAVMFVAAAITAGYATIMLSWGFLLHFWLGLLISVAMAVSSLAALTTFMTLIVRLRPRVIFQDRAAALVRITTSVVAILMLGLPQARAADTSADQIVEKSFMVTKVQDSSAAAIFTLISANGEERIRNTLTRTRLEENGIDNMRFTRFTAPQDIRGTSTLTVEHSNGDDDIWIYLPALKKTRRLVASNKRDSYVGTDFTYGDIIGFRTSDWRNEILRKEPIDGAECFVIQSSARTPQIAETSGYSRRVSWIRADNFVLVKGEQYDRAGALQKLLSVDDIQQVSRSPERWQAMRLQMKNVQSGHQTVIVLKDFKANQGILADQFVPRMLEREQ